MKRRVRYVRENIYFEEIFNQASNEFRLRKEGNYIDPLDELDRLRAAQELTGE